MKQQEPPVSREEIAAWGVLTLLTALTLGRMLCWVACLK